MTTCNYFLGNKPRIKNKLRDSRGLGLVDSWPKNWSNKASFNILRAKNVSRVEARTSTDQHVDTRIRRDNKAGIKENNKVSIKKQNNKSNIRR